MNFESLSLHAKSDEFLVTKTVALDRRRGVLGWLRALFRRGGRSGRSRAPRDASDWLESSDDEFEFEMRRRSRRRSSTMSLASGAARSVAVPRHLRQRLPRAADPAGADRPRRSGLARRPAAPQDLYGREVINDVSLKVRRGEAVGLLGPNGAGKTTVFYMITGLVRPDSGVIKLDGHDVTRLPMYRRARLGIGYLPQEASIFRGLNVEDNIRPCSK